MYYVGIYLLYYLSRTREYLADAFSAERVEARHLATALVKIAYGIVQVEDTDATQSLLQSTRHMGVIDVKNARYSGLEAESSGLQSAERASEAMLFDALQSLGAPHRAQLDASAHRHAHRPPRRHRQAEGASRSPTTTSRPRRCACASTRARCGASSGASSASSPSRSPCGARRRLLGDWPLAPAAAAIGVLVTLRLRYPSGTAQPTTVAALMTNPAASPVIGRPAQLTGKAIGRANPGFIAGEDVVYQDQTGLLTVDFRSMLGFIGDLFAGWKRVPKHLGQQGQVQGWFRRGMGGYVIMKELTSTAGVLRARPYFWQAALSVARHRRNGTRSACRNRQRLPWQFGYETRRARDARPPRAQPGRLVPRL